MSLRWAKQAPPTLLMAEPGKSLQPPKQKLPVLRESLSSSESLRARAKRLKNGGRQLISGLQLSKISNRRTSHRTSLGVTDGAVCTSRSSDQVTVVRAEYHRRIRMSQVRSLKTNPRPPHLISPSRPLTDLGVLPLSLVEAHRTTRRRPRSHKLLPRIPLHGRILPRQTPLRHPRIRPFNTRNRRIRRPAPQARKSLHLGRKARCHC